MTQTAKQGLWKVPVHFVAWAFGWMVAGYVICHRYHWMMSNWLRLTLLIGFAAVILAREIGSTSRGAQTVGKGIIDFTAKVGGWAAGLWTFGWGCK